MECCLGLIALSLYLCLCISAHWITAYSDCSLTFIEILLIKMAVLNICAFCGCQLLPLSPAPLNAFLVTNSIPLHPQIPLCIFYMLHMAAACLAQLFLALLICQLEKHYCHFSYTCFLLSHGVWECWFKVHILICSEILIIKVLQCSVDTSDLIQFQLGLHVPTTRLGSAQVVLI